MKRSACSLARIAGLVIIGALMSGPALNGVSAELGDPAAGLQVSEWVKGKHVDLAALKGKQIAVVEFWATWCPPCRASIPHITKLQKKYKDVVFVGISSEKSDTVKKFVESMAENMDYAVGVDNEGKTSESYMGAYSVDGIPHAFVVDLKGRVVWHGHPMNDLDKVLDEVLAGKFDVAVSKRRAQAQELIQKFVAAVSKGSDDAEADKLGSEIEAIDKEVGGIMPGRKFETAEVRKAVKFQLAMNAYHKALVEGADEAETRKLADAAKAVVPKDVDFAEVQEQLNAQIVFTKYMDAVSGKGDESKAAELGRKLEQLPAKNAQMLNSIAWILLTEKSIVKRDLPLALKIAKSAHDASGGKDAAIEDTYARALFDNGKVDDAVQVQKKAIALASDKGKELVADLEATLKKYEKKAEENIK